jgi:hypothetical protein
MMPLMMTERAGRRDRQGQVQGVLRIVPDVRDDRAHRH